MSPSGVELAGALGRRARAAADAVKTHAPEVVVTCGGRAWAGRLEAEALAEELGRLGVGDAIVQERSSLTTRGNARFSRTLLAERNIDRVVLVTCAWHMRRAAALFRDEGFVVVTHAADPGRATWRQRAYRNVRERVAANLDRMVARLVFLTVLSLAACGHASGASDASPQDASIDAGADLASIEMAEDARRAELVTDGMRTSRDVNVRRHAARALSRIADGASEAGLMRALADEDPETAAWGAYGLGFSCKGHEEPRVRALAARAASFDMSDAAAPRAPIDFGFAVSRALGRCGGPLAELTLAAWVKSKARSLASREQAAYGIGDVAARRGAVDDDTATALLDAAADGVVAAFYPFGRAERFNDAFASRLALAAKLALAGTKSDARVFAVRALGKTGDSGIAELSRVATTPEFTWSERIDAMRSLGKLGESGRVAVVEALSHIVPDPNDPFAVLTAAGDVYGEIIVGLGALGETAPPAATKLLTTLSTMKPAGDAPAQLARRFANLRCTSASLLSQGSYDAQTIRACDGPGEILDRARLSSLLRRPLGLDRRKAWLELAKSDHLKIREDAISAIGRHRELGDVGLAVLAAALGDTPHPGVVATAAEVLSTHPDRAMTLSAKERKNALDPHAPPPTGTPDQEVAPVIAKALSGALAFKWSDDAIETRTGLLDAAAAVHLPSAKEAAKAACSDSNTTMRDHAARALRLLGDDKTICVASASPTAAKEIATAHGGKLVLTTDAGILTIIFDADVAPIASSRILDLAKAGFFEGNIVHRVVPGFVVQLGDPHADGYGGSGTSLRCETSPIPFGPLDVGMALAGRDTGSSQFFVTLGRFPHLDGDYARVGRAEGDWFAVAEGDVVQHATIVLQ